MSDELHQVVYPLVWALVLLVVVGAARAGLPVAGDDEAPDAELGLRALLIAVVGVGAVGCLWTLVSQLPHVVRPDELISLPVSGADPWSSWVADRGRPSLMWRPLAIAVGGVGGVLAIRWMHGVLLVALAALLWRAGRTLSAAPAAVVAAVVLLDPAFIAQLHSPRSYPLMLVFVCAAVGSRRPEWVLGLLALGCLDDPVVLSLLVPWGLATARTGRSRGLAALTLGLALLILPLVLGGGVDRVPDLLPAGELMADSVVRTRLVLLGALFMALAVVPGRERAWWWAAVTGQVVVLLAIVFGLLGANERYALFAAVPTWWVLGRAAEHGTARLSGRPAPVIAAGLLGVLGIVSWTAAGAITWDSTYVGQGNPLGWPSSWLLAAVAVLAATGGRHASSRPVQLAVVGVLLAYLAPAAAERLGEGVDGAVQRRAAMGELLVALQAQVPGAKVVIWPWDAITEAVADPRDALEHGLAPARDARRARAVLGDRTAPWTLLDGSELHQCLDAPSWWLVSLGDDPGRQGCPTCREVPIGPGLPGLTVLRCGAD